MQTDVRRIRIDFYFMGKGLCVGLIAALILSARLLDVQVPNFYRGPAAAAPDAIDAAAVDPAPRPKLCRLGCHSSHSDHCSPWREEVSPGSTNGGVASFAPLGSPSKPVLLLNPLRNPRIKLRID
jgi:hypothetical protein